MQTLKPVTKPSKQRKMLYQAPDHIRHKFFAAPLSPELKASYGLNSIPVRSGDTVRIMRGDHKGFEGRITRVDRKKFRIYVDGLTREKVDGTTIFVPLHPSKVMITRLNLDDKWRKEILEKKARKKPEEVVEVKEKIIEEKVTVEKKKPPEKKPRKKKRKRETAKKPMKKEEKAEKIEEKVSKTRRQRAKRKTTKKKEGEK